MKEDKDTQLIRSTRHSPKGEKLFHEKKWLTLTASRTNPALKACPERLKNNWPTSENFISFPK